MKHGAVLDNDGRFAYDLTKEQVDAGYPVKDYTLHPHLEEMPGPGAVYNGVRGKSGEWTGGEWVYDEPVPPDPDWVEKLRQGN